MADSGELSHKSRTNGPKSDPLLLNRVTPRVAALDVATEFQKLIDEHGKLSDDYAALLAQFPGPIPDSQPTVPMQGKDGTVRLVAAEVTERGLRPLPEREQARYAETQARRCSLLAVHQPFVRVYWRPDAAGPAHKAANDWRARFSVVMKRLRRLYRSLNRRVQLALDQEAQLHDFPLLRAAAASCGLSGEDILEAFQTHIEHLTDDLANLDSKDALPPALPDGIGARLRKARLAEGDTLEHIAEMFECHVSTISRIERNKLQRPSKYLGKIQGYILKPGK
jgi:hypothetical protein